MTSFSIYSQSNNCNLNLKNSIFFTIYNKHSNKFSYLKSNNHIRGFNKDAILNDYIYFASNGLKKDAIFRKKEIYPKIKTNNFISYFNNLEDDLLVFNLYSQKYYTDVINQYISDSEITLKTTKNKNIENSLSIFKDKSKLHLNTKNFLVKNYFDKYLFVSNNGLIKELSNRIFQKNLFSGLLYVLPQNVQIQIKNLFAMNHLSLCFLTNIKSKSIISFSNILIYVNYLKFLNFRINKFFSKNNIKIRKSNLLLHKYLKVYSATQNNILNFLYLINTKKYLVNNFTNINFVDSFFSKDNKYFNNKTFDFNSFTNSLNIKEKVTVLRYINSLLLSNSKHTFENSSFNNSIILNYFSTKIAVLNNLIGVNKKFNYVNFYSLLTHSVKINNIDSIRDSNGFLSNQLFLRSEKAYESNLESSFNFDNFKYPKTRPIISFKKSQELINPNIYTTVSSEDLKNIKKDIIRFKRSFIRKKRHKKVLKKVNKSFTLTSRNFKIAKLKKIKTPWLRIYNKENNSL